MKQRVPASAMNIGDPRGETFLALGFAVGYIVLSAVTGLLIRRFPAPLVQGAYFTHDLWYLLGFKIGALLLLPVLWMRARGYRIRDLSPGWTVGPRTVTLAVLSFAAGASLNARHFGPIQEAAAGLSGFEVALRTVVGLALPLISAAIPEEVVYRGLVQTRLERTAGRLVAVLTTALLFAAWHVPSRYVMASGVEGSAGDLASVMVGTFLPVFVVGLVFGILYDRYRQLVPLIAAHWGVDAVIGVAALHGLPI